MLYHLLSPENVGISLFTYITFRGAFAAMTAFALAVLIGPRVIAWLRGHHACENTDKSDSETLRELHADKSETPTMGGILILGVVLTSVLLWARMDQAYVWGAVLVLVVLGGVGLRDDWIKLTAKRRHGMSAKRKLALICGLALFAALMLYGKIQADGDHALLALQFPFVKTLTLDLNLWHGVVYIGLVMLVIASCANAVNLTDGLDGLAIGCVTFAAMTLAVYSYVAGHAGHSAYLDVTPVPGAGELAVVAGALVGGGLGFLWFNCYPAQVFMGDTGSLPLGGILGYIAVVARQELMLVVIGGIFVLEALSVILQVGSFKLRGKRVLKCAPLHHHFEFGGLSEPKVTVRFWIVASMLAMFGVACLKLR